MVAAAVTAALVAACSSSAGSQAVGGQAASSGAAGDTRSLKGVCPDTVKVQDEWWPQAEYASLYHLFGSNPTVDTGKGTVTGKLVDNGFDTGVNLETVAGGPANHFTPAASILYTDKSVLLGGADIDKAAQLSATKPVLPVFAPMNLSPVVLMWDPAAHPTFNTISDIGQTGTKVLYFGGSTYMDYLTGSGILKKSQVSPTYDGTPQHFIADRGQDVQQGFLTNEVWSYPTVIPQWRKPIRYALVADSGYPVYPEALSINPDRKAELAPCLKKLVPILQRSEVAYLADPKPTNDLIVNLVKQMSKLGAYPYSSEQAANAAKVMKQVGIMGNGTGKTIGSFDPTRVQRIINIVKPIFAAQHTPIKDGLTASQLVTNEFVDPSIGAPSS